MLTCAKALAGGVAAGVMMARPEVAAVLKPGMHASTFGGNPIACRAALAAIETIEADGLLARGAAIGERFRDHFEAIRAERARPGPRYPRLGDHDRARPDRSTPRPSLPECMKRRLLINATHGHVVRLLPALTITDDQIDEGCAILADVLAADGVGLSRRRDPTECHGPSFRRTCSTSTPRRRPRLLRLRSIRAQARRAAGPASAAAICRAGRWA